MAISDNPIADIQSNLEKLIGKINYLAQENDILLKASTELRKIASSSTNDLYSVTNDLLNQKRSANNTVLNKMMEERSSKEQSIAKLAALFEQLSAITDSQAPMPDQGEGAEGEEASEIMEIREDLDEDGNVIRASVQPQYTPPSKIADGNSIESNKEVSKEKPAADVLDNTNEEGLPFMNIREDIDAEGNVLNGNVAPQIGGDEIESLPSSNSKSVVEEDQIMELFEDMGITAKKDNEVKHESEPTKELTEFERNLKKKLAHKSTDENNTAQVDEATEENKSNNTESLASVAASHGIPQDEILALEIIADELADDDDETDAGQEYAYADEEEWAFDDEDDDDDDEDDFEPPSNDVTDLLMSQIQNLRVKNKPKLEELNDSLDEQPTSVEKPILKAKDQSSIKKKKKSVKFDHNNLEQVKEIENVSEELKNINNNDLKTSLFKQFRQSRNSEPSNTHPIRENVAPEKDQILAEAVKERLIVETPSAIVNTPQIKPSSYPGLLTPVIDTRDAPAKPKVSRFKQNMASSNKSSVPNESIEGGEKLVVEPKKKKSAPKGKKISVPSITPFRSTADLQSTEEVISSEKVESDESGKVIEVNEATIDFQSMGDDIDSMAKAYILGLYDDDVVAPGEIVEKLEDFEKINKLIEAREKSQRLKSDDTNGSGDIIDADLNEVRYNEDGMDAVVQEIDEEDDAAILADQVVEREIADLDDDMNDELENQPAYLENSNDISVSSSVLNQQVASHYNTLRTKLLFDQNKFQKSDEEKAFEPIDEHGNNVRVSRFKAARLVQKNSL